jgi:hypothetical protein
MKDKIERTSSPRYEQWRVVRHPRFGSMSRLAVTPYDIFVVERALSANGIRRLVDLSRRGLCRKTPFVPHHAIASGRA